MHSLTVCVAARHAAAVAGWMKRAWRWILTAADDALPMPPDQRAARDWHGETSDAESLMRKRQLNLHLMGKRGRGGFR